MILWELIRENQRRSWILFIAMGGCLLALGYALGLAWMPHQDGGVLGMMIAALVWFVMSLISYFSGDSILLSMSGAKEVNRNVHPQLFNIVEEMKIAANLPVMPRIYIIDSPASNAFATGRSSEKSAVAVTAGLLSRLNRDELQGVIAHEMSHVVNRDVLYMTFAGVLLGSIVMLSELFLRSQYYSLGSRRYRSSSRDNNQAQAVMMVVALVFAILAPILARLFYFSLSRRREYLADASAVRLTRYPEGLASALEKISRPDTELASANRVTASMYIVNPLKLSQRQVVHAFSTHPPVEERIKILRSMMKGANYKQYADAFSKVKGNASLMPASALADSEPIPLRSSSSPAEDTRSSKQKARDLGDLMRVLNDYMFIPCACGLRIKIPPDFNRPTLACPRCRRQHDLRSARPEPAGSGA
ncbi:MAG TPA: M48 family metallopeptidase [Candidatus Omnitrophota bacterium]|nr:M48 family metallopeptidase [Candidatus Omnitrophota bacterium]